MRKLVVMTALSLAGLTGCAKSDDAKPAAKAEDSLPAMTVDEVDRALAAKQVVPVDCNSDATRKRAGVVPGAILVSDEDSYAAAELPSDKTAKLVFYCANAG